AQVFLLQYAEGFPMQRVGWGRASAKDIQAMSLLHARLFDVFARSAYMAPRVGGLIARAIAADLTQPKAPAVHVYVGHDNTIAAVTAILGVHFKIPGYGVDDPPIGGGLLFERLTDRRTHKHVIRLSYVAQTPSAARHLSTAGQHGPIVLRHLPIGRYGTLCPLPIFQRVIDSETAQLL
ncbi:MAG: histidine-type phosphatase, partial [Sphingomonadaceae bacterium]